MCTIDTQPGAVALVDKIAQSIALKAQTAANLRAWKATKRKGSKAARRMGAGMRSWQINRVAQERYSEGQWEQRVKRQLGGLLLKLLIDTAKIPANGGLVPAFKHKSEVQDPGDEHPSGRVWMTDEAELLIRQKAQEFAPLEPRVRPSRKPPGCPAIVPKLNPEGNTADLSNAPEVKEAIVTFSAVPWRINRRMLEIVEWIWETGGRREGEKNLKVPKCLAPEELKQRWAHWGYLEFSERNEASAHRGFERMLDRTQKRLSGRASEPPPAWYFQHNIDFTGRLYPLPRQPNHQGDDTSRALLEFDRAIPLGKAGRRWIMIHLANCCGQDKLPFGERVEWVRANEAMMRKWAEPDGYKRNEEWREQKKPLEALAAAIALYDEHDGGQHAMRLPVHGDASCNVLQHYVAMLRDERLALETNVYPDDKPHDFYQTVIDAAKASIDAAMAAVDAAMATVDAATGVPLIQPTLGTVMTRSVLKTTIMTLFYSVTERGALEQIVAAINEEGYHWQSDEDRKYVPRRMLYSIVMAIKGTKASSIAYWTMTWFNYLADHIASQEGVDEGKKEVHWTTPLGMIVQQRYRRMPRERIEVPGLQELTFQDWSPELPVDSSAQARAFAANYVHSLDAAHAMRTALVCRSEKIDVATVHDSYWAHACNMDRLRDIVRQQFYELHAGESRLNMLYGDVVSRYPHIQDWRPPPREASRQNFDLSRVLKSEYFLS